MKKFISLFLLAFVAICACLAPQETTNVLAVLAVTGAAVVAIAHLSRASRRNGLICAINTLPANVGTTVNKRRYRSSAALATRNVFVKQGADDEHIAAIAAVSDKPLGVIDDEADAAESPIAVEIAGVTNATVIVRAGAAIATLHSDLYIDSVGRVVGKPTAAGTYWKVGRNLTLASAANDPVEVALCEPRKLIVIAALGNLNSEISGLTIGGTYSQSEVQALRTACEELADDVRAIAAALDGNADVALATT